MNQLVSYIEELESRGGRFLLVGDRVQVEYPAERREAVAPILGELRAHRREVIQVLRERLSSEAAACFHCSGSSKCDCMSCGMYTGQMIWSSGDCLACKARVKGLAQ